MFLKRTGFNFYDLTVTHFNADWSFRNLQVAGVFIAIYKTIYVIFEKKKTGQSLPPGFQWFSYSNLWVHVEGVPNLIDDVCIC